MPAPLDLFSTEDHGHHLRREVVRKRVLTLRPDNTMVKQEKWRPGGLKRQRKGFHSKSEEYLSPNDTKLRAGA